MPVRNLLGELNCCSESDYSQEPRLHHVPDRKSLWQSEIGGMIAVDVDHCAILCTSQPERLNFCPERDKCECEKPGVKVEGKNFKRVGNVYELALVFLPGLHVCLLGHPFPQ